MHKSDSPLAYLLVTFLVTHDGELGHPMDTIVKRVDLTADGQPVAIARLTEAIVREIARKARVGLVPAVAEQEDDLFGMARAGEVEWAETVGHDPDLTRQRRTALLAAGTRALRKLRDA